VSIAFWSKFCPVDFGVPPTQTSVEHGYWEQKGLTSTLTNQGPYEFAVSGGGYDYIYLLNTYLFVEAQIVNTDGSNFRFRTFGRVLVY
jgi:hypothetical protein